MKAAIGSRLSAVGYQLLGRKSPLLASPGTAFFGIAGGEG